VWELEEEEESWRSWALAEEEEEEERACGDAGAGAAEEEEAAAAAAALIGCVYARLVSNAAAMAAEPALDSLIAVLSARTDKKRR